MRLRLATFGDAQTLLDWRNDATTREGYLQALVKHKEMEFVQVSRRRHCEMGIALEMVGGDAREH